MANGKEPTMKKNEIQVGKHYVAKVSGHMATVRIDGESRFGGWDATNLRTSKKVRIKSAQRLRGLAPKRSAKRKVVASPAQNASAPKVVTKEEYEAQAKGESKAAGKPAEVGPRVKHSPKTAADTAKPAKRATGERGAKGVKRVSGLDAAAKVLAEAKQPLTAKVIVEQMLAKDLWQTNGKTPTATIYAAMIREIAAKGDKARFRKVERGKFELAK